MTHKFLPPALVNYSKPFRFVITGKNDKIIYEHSYNEQDEIIVTQVDTGEKFKYYNFGDMIQKNIESGAWMVIEEPFLGETFNFLVGGDDTIYTYTKLNNNQAEVSWPSKVVGGVSSHTYHIKDVIGCIEEGWWSVLPTEPAQSAEQSSENAFKALEDIVRNHKQLNMENGSAISFATGDDSAWESSDTILDSIKAFTQSGKLSIGIHKGVYTVYGKNDEYKATSDKQLVEVMKALEILEDCLGD